ncbi:MAG: UDP-N-acetylmuramoyl-L-alanyl-D-glutamate--2,6-diaminopimelate ligase, partial [Roseiflexaceae bacterium]|nr:UDP-N-acetylmuramoyl-L-alanyl-D-glutamate--2,6-diaminopimelate ligase [Roseiflexaceae bacterium]
AGLPAARVPNARSALAPIAAAFYRHPGRQLRVVGITGTKGKTTTSTLASGILDSGDHRSGLITTVDFKIGARWWPNGTRQTTPEALEVQSLLRDMADAGCDYAVVESSSHALSPGWNRLGGCEYDLAVLTNITHEHLDYHGSFAQYRADKAELFRMLATSAREKIVRGELVRPPKLAIVNLDDPNAQFFLDSAPGVQAMTYAVAQASADVRAVDIVDSRTGLAFTAVTPQGQRRLELALAGSFNVPNVLAALCIGLSQGIALEQCAQALEQAPPVRGRMALIDAGQPFTVIVDYAHNPDSFEKLFAVMRPLTKGKLIALFGSAGERDLEKRPSQGAIAARFCDLLVLADEDPRGEDRNAIIAQIALGAQAAGMREGSGYLRIADRAQAIRAALAQAAPGDIVLLLGKGHEGSIIYADHKLPWDEAAEARAALAELGWRSVTRGQGDTGTR